MDFEAAFARHHASLFRYLHRLTGDADVAADIAQESFVRLLEHDVPEAGARNWLFTVATNLVRDRARTQSRRRRLLAREGPAPAVAPAVAPRPDDEVERDERIDSVRRVLDGLSDRDRRMLMLREEGFRYAEIAELVGVAPASVGKLLTRALTRFARAYEGQGAGAGYIDDRDEHGDG